MPALTGAAILDVTRPEAKPTKSRKRGGAGGLVPFCRYRFITMVSIPMAMNTRIIAG